MNIIFLGTSSGKTSLSRFCSSVLLKNDKYNLLVDTGDGISKALISSNIEFGAIDGILFSHYHADHFGGITSLITQMKLINRERKLSIYTHKKLKDSFVAYLETSYLFPKILGFELDIIDFEFDELVIFAEGMSFIGKQNSHIQNRNDVVTDIPFISLSFLFHLNDTVLFYTSDIGSVKDLFLFEKNKCDLMISEATHISSEELKEAFRSLKPEQMYLTHYDDEDLVKLKNDFNESNVFIAHDGMKIELT